MMVRKVFLVATGLILISFLLISYYTTTIVEEYNNKKTDDMIEKYLLQPLSPLTVQHNSQFSKYDLSKVVEEYNTANHNLKENENVVQNNSGITKFSPFIEIMNRQKRIISHETRDYKFPHGLKLQDFTLATKGRPVRTVIISSWRSGSTFLGDILNSVPGNFYHYEPLLEYGLIQIRGAPFASSALAQIKDLLHCDYTHLDSYLDFGKIREYYFTNNKRLWSYCKPYNFCWNAPILSEFCKLFPFQSMKTVRLRLEAAGELLSDSLLNVKVVLLVRDPRGTFQSRKKPVEWCKNSLDCTEPNIMCSDMVSDYKAATELRIKYPNSFRAISYEELSLNPYDTVQELFNFLGLDFHSDVKQYLDSHTKQNMGHAYSTFRDSKKTAFHWQQDLNLTEIQLIEKNCVDAMRLWGYFKFAKDDNFIISN